MKKLLFVALGIVALTSSSMQDASSLGKSVDCQRTFNSTYIYARNVGFSDQQANSIAFAAYDKCLGCGSTTCSQ